jgi:hypothetical protein
MTHPQKPNEPKTCRVEVRPKQTKTDTKQSQIIAFSIKNRRSNKKQTHFF